MLAGPSCADASASRRASPARGKSVAGKQTVDRGVGPTPAPSPLDSQLPLYLGAVPPYLADPRHAGFVKVDAGLGQYYNPRDTTFSVFRYA